MERKPILMTVALSSLLLIPSVNAQNKEKKSTETELEKIVADNPLSIDDGITYGITVISKDSFLDNVDSVLIIDTDISSDPIRLVNISTTEILDYSLDTIGDVIIENGDANMLFQNHNLRTDDIYSDIIDQAYIPTVANQKYAFLFLSDRDYTFKELRAKFYLPQEVNGLDIKLNLADGWALEAFLHNPNNEVLVKEMMLEKEYLEVFAIGNENIFDMQTTVSILNSNGRAKKTYNISGFALATLSKYEKKSKKIHVHSGLTSKYTHELYVPAGTYILLTSKENVSL